MVNMNEVISNNIINIMKQSGKKQIDLAGYLRILRQRKSLTDMLDYPCDIVCTQKSGSTATKIQGVCNRSIAVWLKRAYKRVGVLVNLF